MFIIYNFRANFSYSYHEVSFSLTKKILKLIIFEGNYNAMINYGWLPRQSKSWTNYTNVEKWVKIINNYRPIYYYMKNILNLTYFELYYIINSLQ